MIEPPLLLLVAAIAAMAGTVGGFGGAILLVPVLVTTGVDPIDAAPIGVVVVAAGALAAAPSQLAHGLVHQRLGLTVEIPASSAAVVAAVVSVHVPGTALQLVLAGVALVAGLVGLSGSELHYTPRPAFVAEPPAEWPGTLGGTYAGPSGAVPYHARRLPLGLTSMVAAGAVSGLAGVGGGFVKTPVMREVMWIPVKVAAATSTFTMGITGAATLVVFARQGRLDPALSAAAALGGLVGGMAGSRVQDRLAPARIRALLAIALIGIAVVLVVGAR